MKRRAEGTTSERELALALAESGRATSLAALSGWRKDGLLPPFASQGVGAGRSYYWREPDIFARACTVFDFLKKYDRVDTALWMLWLCGYQVPLARLRRFWLHRHRTRQPWMPRLSRPAFGIEAGPAFTPSSLLFKTACLLGGAFPSDDRCAATIERALMRFTRANRAGDDIGHAWSMLQMISAALEASTLLVTASDTELHEAQDYLRLAAIELEGCAEERGAWRRWLADRVGAKIFLLILALLKSGQREILEAIAFRLERPDRRNVPDRPHHKYA